MLFESVAVDEFVRLPFFCDIAVKVRESKQQPFRYDNFHMQ